MCECVCVGTRLLGLNLRWGLHVPGGEGDDEGSLSKAQSDEWEESDEKTIEELRHDTKQKDENIRRRRPGKRVRTGGQD